MKKLLLMAVLCLCVSAWGQNLSANGGLKASTTDCTVDNSCVSLAFMSDSVGAASIQLTGTWVATISFEGTVDGVTWVAISGTPTNSTTAVTSATANGAWIFQVGGLTNIRARCSAFTSGTANALVRSARVSAGGIGGGGGAVAATTTGADAVTNTAVSSITGATNNPLGTAPTVFNGTTWDRMRSATSATATTGTGLPGVGILGFDGTNYGRVAIGTTCTFGCPLSIGPNVTAADGVANTSMMTPITPGSANGASPMGVWTFVFNGSTWDRSRSVVNGQNTTGTGVNAVGDLCQLDDTSTGAVTENQWAPVRCTPSRQFMVSTVGPGGSINCLVAVSTATTIQAVGGSCVAPGAGLSVYITDIEFGSSAASGTAADSFPTLKSGTTGTCGTGTAVIWQGLSTANSTIVVNLSQPIKVAANSEVCWIMTTAGSKTIQLHGYIAP